MEERAKKMFKDFPDKLEASVAADLLCVEGHEDDGVLVPVALGPYQS